MSRVNSQNDSDAIWIPDGYILMRGPGHQPYIVPEFFAPTLQQSLDAHRQKSEMGIKSAEGTVSFFFCRAYN